MGKNGSKHRSSSNTVVTSFRISRNHQRALKNLPPQISASVVVRTLLEEYLNGNLPDIHALVIAEAGRTQDAISESKF